MTTRLGNGALGLLQQRTHRTCDLFRITRRDGVVIRMTSHDRAVEFGGETYLPQRSAAVASDRREAGFRSQAQEAFGIIDDDLITEADLRARLYDGAEVLHVVTDWMHPWMWSGRHRRWIRQVVRDAGIWRADLDGRAAQMQRRNGGRFGGTFQRTCPYRLGDRYCQVDMAVGGGNAYLGPRVDTVSGELSFSVTAGTWPGTFEDDWFRDGEIEWIFGAAEATGTTTADSTTTEMEDSGAAWSSDEHAGKIVAIYDGSGGGIWSVIVSNTSTTLTFEEVETTVPSGSAYEISPPAANFGHSSPIISNADATRTVEILLPTPFPVAAGDGGILRVGCDGLRGTCKDKFGNLDQFGGDPFAPSPADILRPAT